MGLRGPAPKPTALRVIEGNPSRRPLNAHEPKPRDLMPRCPAIVRDNKRALQGWRELVKITKPMRVLTEADGPALEKLALSWARLRELEEEINKRGIGVFIQSYKTKNNTTVAQVSAIYSIYRAELDFFVRGLTQFGLTPAARSRIQVAAEKQSDPDDLLNGNWKA